MPTIYHRACCLMVGTLRFAHPTIAGSRILICPNKQIKTRFCLLCKLRPIGTTGKSVKPVQPLLQKYFASAETQISRITPPVSRQMRGVGHRHERAVRCDGR